jgi:C4-dicarboxylate transporter, DctM subunit
MDEVTLGIVAIIVLCALFLTGIELAFGMAIIGTLGYAFLVSPEAAVNLLANDFYDTLTSYSLTVIPLFILMGQIAFHAGLAGRLYETANKWVGHVPGGLALATVVGATLFKAICGSSTAAVATLSSIAVPEMDKYGYDKKLSTGAVAMTGTLGMLIPPATVLIIIGLITQQSIGKLFLAGIVPGLLLAIGFGIVIIGWAKINPGIAPKCEKATWNARLKSSYTVIWPILIFIVLIGGLLRGIFTPTEAGSIGAFVVLVLCLIRKDIGFKMFVQSLRESVRTGCMTLLIIGLSSVLSHFIAVTNIPAGISDWIVASHLHPAVVVSMIFIVYLLGGSFIDDLAFMIMATPVFFPVMTSIGFDPIWICIMIALTVSIGAVLPPVAITVFVVKNITNVPIGTIYKGVYPFLTALVGVAVLMFIFPQLITYLPKVLMK